MATPSVTNLGPCGCCGSCDCDELPLELCAYHSLPCVCPLDPCQDEFFCNFHPESNCDTQIWECNRLRRSIFDPCRWETDGQCQGGGDFNPCGSWSIHRFLQKNPNGSWTLQIGGSIRPPFSTVTYSFGLTSTVAADGSFSCDPFAMTFRNFQLEWEDPPGSASVICPNYGNGQERFTVTILSCCSTNSASFCGCG